MPENTIDYKVEMPSKIVSRVLKIRQGDTPMVVARREDGFQIGYEGTVWAEAVKQTQSYVTTFDHTAEHEFISMTLQRAL